MEKPAASAGCSVVLKLIPNDVVFQPRRPDLAYGVVERTSEQEPAEGESIIHRDWVCVEFEEDVMCVPVNQLKLVDRFIDCGNRVARCDHGVGMVINVNITATVFVNGQHLRFNTKDLRPTRELFPGLVVTMDGWIGRVTSCVEMLTVTFGCGAVGLIKASPKHMHQERRKVLLLEPGEQVVVLKEYLRDANWITPPNMSHVPRNIDAVAGIINKVDIESVDIAWQQSVSGAGARPPTTVSGADMAKLRVPREFLHTAFRVGDRVIVPRPGPDGKRRSSDPMDRAPFTTRTADDGDLGRITLSQTSVVVLWPSGEVEGDINCLSVKLLPPVTHLASALVVPGMPVTSRKAEEDEDARIGIIQACNCKERTTTVKWFDMSDLQKPYPEPPSSEPVVTSESVFDLVIAQELLLSPGDYVAWDGPTPRPLSRAFGEVMRVHVNGSVDVVWFDRSMSTENVACLALVNPDSWEDEMDEDSDGEEEVPRTPKKCAINALKNMFLKRLRKVRAAKPVYCPEYKINTKFAVLDEDPVYHSFYSRTVERSYCPKEAIRQVASACNLPSGVQVFSFGSRLDLIRAVVFGKPDSLYDAGVFIFDFYIPSDYPKVPPEVRYVPLYRNKINPNLHEEEGKICMSILRTTHSKCGGWQSNNTISQILACIQSGLLNNDPLAGTDFHCPSNSAPFHEDIFVSMAQVIKRISRELSKDSNKALEGVDRLEILTYLKHAAVRLRTKIENILSAAPTPLAFRIMPPSEGFERTLRSELLPELTALCQQELAL